MQPVNFDEYNFTGGEPIHHAIRSGTKQSTGVVQPFVKVIRSGARDENGNLPPMYTLDTVSQHGVAHNYAVRRLTPIECERLMGWPDDHTRWKADGTEQADSHRYKQCGNGVATPVAKWIADQLKGIL